MDMNDPSFSLSPCLYQLRDIFFCIWIISLTPTWVIKGFLNIDYKQHRVGGKMVHLEGPLAEVTEQFCLYGQQVAIEYLDNCGPTMRDFDIR